MLGQSSTIFDDNAALDYEEIEAIPALPIYALIAADRGEEASSKQETSHSSPRHLVGQAESGVSSATDTEKV